MLDVLVIGGRGMAGAAVIDAARARGLSAKSLSRQGDLAVDIRDAAALRDALAAADPRLIVNAAAIVSIPDCEADPAGAWLVNARPAALLADHARRSGAKLIQVSTDHYWTGDGARPHRENEPVVLLNEYARTKYAAEGLALAAPEALVLRTNIVGTTAGSFGDWALKVVDEDQPATLFTDHYASSLDVWNFAEILLDLKDATGVINASSAEIASKAAFVHALATARGRTLTKVVEGSVGQQSVRRAESVGLDVSRAEDILGQPLPRLADVVRALAERGGRD